MANISEYEAEKVNSVERDHILTWIIMRPEFLKKVITHILRGHVSGSGVRIHIGVQEKTQMVTNRNCPSFLVESLLDFRQ